MHGYLPSKLSIPHRRVAPALSRPTESTDQTTIAGIGDLGAQWLCKGISALCRNQSRGDHTGAGAGAGGSGIRDLRLRGNNITHSGAKELAKLLSEDRCARDLRELDLSMNTITADGFRPLAVSLRGCRELVRLDVAGCRLGPGGVDAAADLIAAAGPRLRSVILTPKAEFADRVLGDRGGLAVALRQSLQRLADSLPFAAGVVEVGLGAFLRADPGAAASIEDALRERRERERAAAGAERSERDRAGGGGDGGKRDTTASGSAGGGAAGGGSSSRSSEKTPRSANGGGGSRVGGRATRGDGAGTPLTVSSSAGGTRRTGASTPRASGTATTPGSSSRITPIRSREAAGSRHGTRGTGIERPKAGLERPKPGTAERVRRGAAGSRTSPPSAGSGASSSSSLHRASSKASMRGGAAAAAGAGGSGRSSERSSRQQHKTTAATLAARDRAAAAQPAPHKRMHQGEELDSIEGFSPMVSRHAPPPPPPPSAGLPPTPSSRRLVGGNPAETPPAVGRTHSRTGSRSFRTVGGGEAHGAGGGSGDVADSIADVVSKVMGDTAAMADDQESPPSVAPSTWEWQDDGAAASAAAAAAKAKAKAAGRSRRTSADSTASAGGVSSRGERGEGSKALSRKSSAASVRAVPDSGGTSKSGERWIQQCMHHRQNRREKCRCYALPLLGYEPHAGSRGTCFSPCFSWPASPHVPLFVPLFSRAPLSMRFHSRPGIVFFSLLSGLIRSGVLFSFSFSPRGYQRMSRSCLPGWHLWR